MLARLGVIAFVRMLFASPIFSRGESGLQLELEFTRDVIDPGIPDCVTVWMARALIRE